MKNLILGVVRKQEARRVVAALVLAAMPMLYAVPGGSMHYMLAWAGLFNGTAIYSTILLGAGLQLTCYAIPLATPVCIVMTAA
jgi:hypothetical protein